jgi:hypothetical protein
VATKVGEKVDEEAECVWEDSRKTQENGLTGCAWNTGGNGCCKSRCENTVGLSTAN